MYKRIIHAAGAFLRIESIKIWRNTNLYSLLLAGLYRFDGKLKIY